MNDPRNNTNICPLSDDEDERKNTVLRRTGRVRMRIEDAVKLPGHFHGLSGE